MPKKTNDDAVQFDAMEGHDLLRAVETIRPSESVALIQVAQPLMESKDGEMDLGKFGTLLEYIEEHYVTDPEAWQKFYRKVGLSGVMELVAAYLGEAVAGVR